MVQPELILFAKQPIAGEVKTRLQPALSAEQAAVIAAFLIEESVTHAVQCWPGPIALCVAPSVDHPLFRDLQQRYPLTLTEQGAGDLGQRMDAALLQGIQQHGATAIMGCDVPHCPQTVFAQAYSLLASGHRVLGPTTDGGYYFIGAAEPLTGLFGAIPWGSDAVLSMTLERAQKQSRDFVLLQELRDIDTAEDLDRVSADYPVLQAILD